MTPSAITTGIKTLFHDNWTRTPVQYPNKEKIYVGGNWKDPLKLSEWIRLTIKYGGSTIGELGSGGVGHRLGILMVSIFVKANIGELDALAHAEAVETLLRRTDAITGMTFDEPTTDSKGVDVNGFYHVMVSIDFETFIGE